MKNETKITCPNCQTEIDVQDVLANQLKGQITKELNKKLADEKKKYEQKEANLLKERAAFDILKREEHNKFQEKLENSLKIELSKREKVLKSKLEDEKSEQMEDLQKELEEKSKKVKELNKSKAEISRLKREKDELEENIKFQIEEDYAAKLASEKDKIRKAEEEKLEGALEEMQKELSNKSEEIKELNKSKAEVSRLKREKDELKESILAKSEANLNKRLTEEREKISKQEHDKNELALKELRKQLDDQINLTAEMKRKQEQGSMQLQGEVQELAIEEWLADKFPLDTIEEIKKGIRGADCLQVVHTRTKQNCGSIYYESKRTKDFQPSWIEKFKNDIQEKGANIGILVTEAMPKDMDRMGIKNGVWICTFEEFKGLSLAIRESIVQLSNAISSQENKGDKMVMLYDYLTGNEFRMQIEAIVDGFQQMKSDLDTEKRSIMGHWKKREKQIEKVILNTNHMYNSIKGIGGSAIQVVQALELPEASKA